MPAILLWPLRVDGALLAPRALRRSDVSPGFLEGFELAVRVELPPESSLVAEAALSSLDVLPAGRWERLAPPAL